MQRLVHALQGWLFLVVLISAAALNLTMTWQEIDAKYEENERLSFQIETYASRLETIAEPSSNEADLLEMNETELQARFQQLLPQTVRSAGANLINLDFAVSETSGIAHLTSTLEMQGDPESVVQLLRSMGTYQHLVIPEFSINSISSDGSVLSYTILGHIYPPQLTLFQNRRQSLPDAFLSSNPFSPTREAFSRQRDRVVEQVPVPEFSLVGIQRRRNNWVASLRINGFAFPRNLEVGDTIGEWSITEISQYEVTVEHESGILSNLRITF